MLHAFDGLDELEPTVEWGGKEGLHDPWDNSPSLDESTVGSTGPQHNDEGSTSPEAAHGELKSALITHFEFRRLRKDIRWLRHKAPGRRHASPNVEVV